jgi:peptide/nickel transport system substrate-binding protein
VLREQYSSSGSNFSKVNDPTLNGYFSQEYGTADQAVQNSWAAKAQERIISQAYAAPVLELTTVLATVKSVHGVEFGADLRLAQLSDAWIGN